MVNTQGLRGRVLAGMLVIIIALPSCAQIQAMTEPERELSPAEQRLQDLAADYNRTIFEGILIGAVSGAALGAGAGALAAKDNRAAGAATGAIIGAIGGAILGGTGGLYYANLKQQYADQEQRLDAMIEKLRAENAKMEDISAAVHTIVDENRAKIDKIAADLKAKRLSAEQAQRDLKAVDGACASLTKQIGNLRKSQERWREIAKDERAQGDNARIAQMDTEIDRIQGRLDTMQVELDSLTARRVSIVG
ncbi:putative Glycine zipper [uncultured Defluviicoccus sp.]|uniref:Putative Glycine zipper n=1 Tax=metagenome TaxID=256318 RepID=A0A380TBV2_9ZZZZ|nr:putative Glycine zipper [uncultured Defluviicoccus sp.]